MKQILLILLLGLIACSNSSGSNGLGVRHIVDWQSIPPKFHPQITEIPSDAAGVTKINLDLSGFESDVQVVYSSNLKGNEVALRMYTVWAKNALLPSPSAVRRANTLRFVASGDYNCSIQVQNGQITQLEGGCIVRAEIVLPAGAQVEVYNVDKLISARFFPVDNQTFLSDFENAAFSQQKWDVINNYLKSYADTRKTPLLASSELGQVVHGFMQSDEKFRALRMLHRYVSDRANLAAMIDQEFNYFDREKARQIVGL
jgi:hypothetical protein